MIGPLKIIEIGNAAGVILPEELLAHLKAEIGDTLWVTTTPHGITLSSAKLGFGAQMSAAGEVMARRSKAMRELSK